MSVEALVCEAVEWVPNVRCPRCGSAATMTRRTMPLEKGDSVRLRYHLCMEEECHDEDGRPTTFKSVQDLSIS